MEEIARALREKYPKVKVPDANTIRSWTEKQLHDYYERQAYLDSMFSSSEDEDSSYASFEASGSDSETSIGTSENRGSTILGDILQKNRMMKQEVEVSCIHRRENESRNHHFTFVTHRCSGAIRLPFSPK